MAHLHLQGIGKAFKHYTAKSGRLKEWLGFPTQHTPRWVLKDITLAVAPGESVGIVGVNGAGKSTLLKIVAGTTKPTVGTLDVAGRVSALLELGMGFHPEFTGRQNVVVSGQVGGMAAGEVADRMAEIEAFADIGSYIDEPVRTYSSGMQVRLAFAVATALRPDILIVDEALAVGDIFFQQKCYDRIRQFQDQGTILLFVTHSMGTVYSLCDRAILLEGGRILSDGKPKEAIDLYNSTLERHRAAALPSPKAAPAPVPADEVASSPASSVQPTEGIFEGQDAGSDAGSFSHPGVTIDEVALRVGDQPVSVVVSESRATLAIRVRFHRPFDDPHIGFQIRDRVGAPVFMTNTLCMSRQVGAVEAGTTVTAEFQMQLPLAEGDYTVTVGLANGGAGTNQFREALSRRHAALAFAVTQNHDSIVWSGHCNLFPQVAIHRG